MKDNYQYAKDRLELLAKEGGILFVFGILIFQSAFSGFEFFSKGVEYLLFLNILIIGYSLYTNNYILWFSHVYQLIFTFGFYIVFLFFYFNNQIPIELQLSTKILSLPMVLWAVIYLFGTLYILNVLITEDRLYNLENPK